MFLFNILIETNCKGKYEIKEWDLAQSLFYEIDCIDEEEAE